LGNSSDGNSGTDGYVIYNKDTDKLINGERDVDISGDGRVDRIDVRLIKDNYNNRIGDAGFNSAYDINNDGELDVRDIMRIGLQWYTR